jgi:molybdopterin-guanine dinucleotide biosynthesis protein A
MVLAGGRAARLGGRDKPQLEVGGRTMLAAVLAAVQDADRRVVVGPPQPLPDDVLRVREEPPGGGPVAAVRAGLAEVPTDVVVLLAGDLPFLSGATIGRLRAALQGSGVLLLDDTGRDQLLVGAWRTAALRTAVAATEGPVPLRRVLAPLRPVRLRLETAPGIPPPWMDCDTPADLARARRLADRTEG